ncbi:lytic murein transglycosylase [Parahaliea aestuarii]|uniref:Lytic murein transglycosylase n=1 Tax=Parahaliea aestuarii TaxID=1852021 RepID=A0A5C8ZXZ0_9GAMM|nr:lytic murein transglycosylase [Parahaliea aestuarii]TXS93356.1 lytic murein transglycosylase [Parahaliea aestuarii]
MPGKHLPNTIALLLATAVPLASAASTDFNHCRSQLAEFAIAEGIPADLVNATVPDLQEQKRVVELDRKQPEFMQTFASYVDQRVSEQRVRRGRDLLARHGDFLDALQDRFGVPSRYLVAFWGLETNYGGYLGNMPTLDSLATLACDPRRADFFSTEFVNALRLLQRESLEPADMVGSWAGAMGHTQFMPSTYLQYAIDGDGDGRVNLWRSERDALASAANFLNGLGWTPGLRWGRQVTLADEFDYSAAGKERPATLAEWRDRGVSNLDGSPLPAAELPASLLLPSGHGGPAFLVYDNFDVVMRWNNSQSYALSVGLLADRLAGAPAGDYASSETDPVSIAELRRAQEALLAAGYDPGTPDGILGSRTRAALRDFQLAARLPADGYPDRATLNKLLQ